MKPDRLLACRLFILDMDGTLYLGDRVFDGTPDFLRTLARTGRDYIYLTNNSSRAGLDYVNRLRGLGLPCRPEQVLSSGMATALYLNHCYPGQRVCLVGNRALARELDGYGVILDDRDAQLVVAGFDTELDYGKLDRAVHYLRKGVPFIACNPDLVCPMPAGEVLPDCGSICALLTAASGREPYYIGKPNREIIDLIARQAGVPNEHICCVGDRLYTDVAAGQNAGTVTALVLSGETTPEMLNRAATPPDYVFEDVAALARALEA